MGRGRAREPKRPPASSETRPEYACWPLGPPSLPPGTKPIHAGKKSWGIHFCAHACGACIRTRANTGKYVWGIIFEICIRTFANMYLPLRPLPLYGYCGCIHTPLMPIYIYIYIYIFFFLGINFGANTCGACICTQANTGKYSWQIVCVLVLCQGIVCLSSKAPQKKPPKGRSPVPLQFHPCNFWLHPSSFRLHPSNFRLHPDYTYTF